MNATPDQFFDFQLPDEIVSETRVLKENFHMTKRTIRVLKGKKKVPVYEERWYAEDDWVPDFLRTAQGHGYKSFQAFKNAYWFWKLS